MFPWPRNKSKDFSIWPGGNGGHEAEGGLGHLATAFNHLGLWHHVPPWSFNRVSAASNWRMVCDKVLFGEANPCRTSLPGCVSIWILWWSQRHYRLSKEQEVHPYLEGGYAWGPQEGLQLQTHHPGYLAAGLLHHPMPSKMHWICSWLQPWHHSSRRSTCHAAVKAGS